MHPLSTPLRTHSEPPEQSFSTRCVGGSAIPSPSSTSHSSHSHERYSQHISVSACILAADDPRREPGSVNQPDSFTLSGQHRTHGQRGGWFLRTGVLDVAAFSGGERGVRWMLGCYRVPIGCVLRVSWALSRRRWVGERFGVSTDSWLFVGGLWIRVWR